MKAAAALVYLAAGAAYTYLVWGPWDGVGFDPTSSSMLAVLVLLHIVVGAAIGRWWAVLLPLGWSILSVPAEGYDTPVWIIILFQTPFLWAPAVAFGVGLRWVARRVARAS